MPNLLKLLGISVSMLIFGGCVRTQDLPKYVEASVKRGDFGDAPCASVTGNLRPDQSGFSDIRDELIPGAYRIVIAKQSSGWRMAWGVPDLVVLTQAGFFAMSETTITADDGTIHPARAFELTPKGYLAMARPGANCFDFQKYDSVEVHKIEKVANVETPFGLGNPYSVQFSLRTVISEPWATTSEFRYVFLGMYTNLNQQSMDMQKQQTYYYKDGRWRDQKEIMMEASLAAAGLRQSELRPQIAQQGEKLAAAAISSTVLTEDALREKLADDKQAARLTPCFWFPVSESDMALGFWKNDAPPALVMYDNPARGDQPRYKHAMEVIQRLEKLAYVKAQPFTDEPAPGARKGKGILYAIDAVLASAIERQRGHCLPLGTARVESLRVKPTPAGQAFRGWVRLAEARPWTAALAGQFPSVRAILDNGYGVAGTIRSSDGKEIIDVTVEAPRFEIKGPTRPIRIQSPYVALAIEGADVVDEIPGTVAMKADQLCKVSADGEVTGADSGFCNGARSTRAFRRGKAYAEIIFNTKRSEGYPDTWTNAAVTSPRSMSSVSTGAATFSFAGSFNKSNMKNADLIGVALDMDERILYWHRNGEWVTGRPGSGIGEPLIDNGQDYFIAVSVTNKAESWKVNFGASPFRYPPPAGYPAYGAARPVTGG